MMNSKKDREDTHNGLSVDTMKYDDLQLSYFVKYF